MKRSGFALVEAGVLVVVVVVCIAAFVLLLGAEQRRQGRLGEDIGKMRRIAVLTGEYAADNADKFWTLSWRRGQNLSQYPDLNGAATDVQAAANQAVDILRRLAGRTDIAPMTWIAQFTFSQLALADGGYARLPDAEFISAQDRNRLRWSRDPAGFDQGQYPPIPASVGTNARKRFPYSSSFVLPTSFYDHGTPVWNRLTPYNHTLVWLSSEPMLFAAKVSDVAYPSSKVHLTDMNARHFGAVQPFATHDEARLPALFVDGRVTVVASAEANPGWHPEIPPGAAPASFRYEPDTWEPPAVSGGTFDEVIGRFRWTRGSTTAHGLVGRDFGGPETCSGQPGCP